MKKIKFGFLICVLLLLNSCAASMFFDYDNGVDWKKEGKFMRHGIYENQFTKDISVSSERKGIRIGGFSKYSSLRIWIKDTISAVYFIKEELSFPDGTVLEKKSRPMNLAARCYDREGNEIPCVDYYYTCNDFKKKLRQNKHLHLKLIYDVDSFGVVTRYEKDYKLDKKKYYRFAVH